MNRAGFAIERRDIWFWQQGRYLRDGWTICRVGATSDPLSWIMALETMIRPRATRSVDQPDTLREAAKRLVNLMAHDVDRPEVANAWNDLRVALMRS